MGGEVEGGLRWWVRGEQQLACGHSPVPCVLDSGWLTAWLPSRAPCQVGEDSFAAEVDGERVAGSYCTHRCGADMPGLWRGIRSSGFRRLEGWRQGGGGAKADGKLLLPPQARAPAFPSAAKLGAAHS